MATSPESPDNIPQDDFELETQFVVLSFLGLVPSNALDQSFRSSHTTSSSTSAHSRTASNFSGELDSGHLKCLPESTLEQKVHRLTGSEEYIYDNCADEDFSPSAAEDTVDIAPSFDRQEVTDKLDNHLKHQLDHQNLDTYIKNHPHLRKSPGPPLKRRISKGHSFNKDGPQRPSTIAVRSQYLPEDDNGRGYGRQESNGSEVTIPVSLVSSHSAYVDVQQLDVEPLVEKKLLPPEVIPLKKELTNELHELEEHVHKAKAAPQTPGSHPAMSTQGSVLSPEAEVAQYLSMLGDQIQDRYSSVLNQAFESVMGTKEEEFTYETLQQASVNLVGQSTGWTKVTLLLMLSKKLTYGMLTKAPGSIHKMTRYTTKLISDSAAEFIVEKGGWHAIHELDSVCTPLSEEPDGPLLPPTDSSDDPQVSSFTSPSPPGGGGGGEEMEAVTDPSTLTMSQQDTGEGTDAEDLPADDGGGGEGLDEVGEKMEEQDLLGAVGGEDHPDQASASTSSSVEEEADENVRRIRPMIPLWRQQSRDYHEELEEGKRKLELEERMWQRYKQAGAGLLLGIVVGVWLWRRYSR